MTLAFFFELQPIDVFKKLGQMEAANSPRPSLRHAVFLIDTQCQLNLISSDFATSLGIVIDKINTQPIGWGLGGARVKSLTSIVCRWSFPEMKRFELSEFHVVSSESFDVIIGVNSIRKLNLLRTNNRLLGEYAYLVQGGEHRERILTDSL